MHEERSRRPAALRDVLALPADITFLNDAGQHQTGNDAVQPRGQQ